MKNKKLTAIIRGGLLCALPFFFTACNDNKEVIYEGYGIVSNKTDNNGYSIILDDGNLLLPQESYINPAKLKDSTRLYLHFNILEEKDSTYNVRVTYADTILTKNIIPYSESILDSVGNDPVKITRSWFAHGFLNFEFMFAGRSYMDNHSAHMVNLLQCQSEGDKLKFEFRHNAFGDYRDKVYIGVVSFHIQKLVEEQDKPIKMEILFHDSENTTRSIEMTYK